MSKKLISVITIVRNDAAGLERTLRSVIAQNSPEIEHIVVDGASSDGTVDVIRAHANHVNRWVSESDKGIYDAMNKGIALAQGAWICMLNAGDVFEPKILTRVIEEITHCDSISILYGDAYYYYPDLRQRRLVQACSERLYTGMSICHQAVFIPAAIYANYGLYNRTYSFAADFHFLLRLAMSGENFVHMPFAVATFFAGGTSDICVLGSRFESIRILWRLKSPRALKGTLRYIYEVLQQYAYMTLVWALGQKLAARLRARRIR
ncbi:hypothetical protein B9Z45_06195 [Limnohabitans sp. 2KL-17]|uniref:glycosyltransferase family 2 protein n=1 Tax=Limnohabitans sp. 2KL-17 TaxID=1100704 RepID=UPI000D36A16C|nr:glycosyltransferase family 2 protein [Limnohabitans sp. 2KL-17]PUE60910.1 hypothetical protein B9Z45_06195 [Limnohabitans sp. 2KL-17]